MGKMGTLKQNGDQKSHFGPHGDQSPQMGTNVGAVERKYLRNVNRPGFQAQDLLNQQERKEAASRTFVARQCAGKVSPLTARLGQMLWHN